MPITIDVADVAVSLRLATEKANVPAPVTVVLGAVVSAGAEIIVRHAPQAPDAVLNLALIRICGYLYEADPTRSARGQENALRTSGAAALLSQWRVHRALALTDDDEEPLTPVTPAIAIPDPPAIGNFILTANNGVLSWVVFPQP